MKWVDGRSGVVGGCAGNLALAGFEASEGPLRRVKGTVFEGPRSLLIGRACSSAYLTDPVLHWANASWEQHVELSREAKGSGKNLCYLFVTASREPVAVRTWRVPGEIVEAVFRSR